MGPLARKADLIVKELPDELLVYDLARDEAHCLNRAAALVWRHCDGQTSVPQLARFLNVEEHLPEDEALVWLALDRLGKAHLLQERVALSPGEAGPSRRSLLRRWGIGLLLPLVTSIVAPTPAQAVSCVNSCFSTADCVPCFNELGNCVKACFNGECRAKASTPCP